MNPQYRVVVVDSDDGDNENLGIGFRWYFFIQFTIFDILITLVLS